MLKKYLFTLWILAVCFGVWPCSARAESVQLRLKLQAGSAFVYQFEAHSKNPAARATVRKMGEDGQSIESHKQGRKTDVIVGQEENDFSVVSASSIRLKKFIVDGTRDVTTKALATWPHELEYSMVGCYSLNPHGNMEYLGGRRFTIVGITPAVFPIPLPEDAVDIGYEWSGEETEGIAPLGASHINAHVEAFEEKRGYRCVRLRFDFRIPESSNVIIPPTSREAFVNGTKTVWLAVKEGFVVQVHETSAYRPFLTSPDNGKFVRDRKTGQVVIDKRKIVVSEWSTSMTEHKTLSKDELREARRGLYLLKTAQEFWAYRNQQEVAVRCLERFCLNFPHSPWFKAASEQKDYMANWLNTIRSKTKKTEEGG